MKTFFRIFLMLSLCLGACSRKPGHIAESSCAYAGYFDILPDSSVVVISPYDGSRDTLSTGKPFTKIVCMSSSNIACLAAIGARDHIAAVSGLDYLSDIPYEGVPDVGYEASLDYEKILQIGPDLLVAYTVSGAEPQYIAKLRSIGVPLAVIHDHLEEHPLARAEYVRFFGALTGHLQEADSLFNAVCGRYNSLADSVADNPPVKVLLNIPYSDAWYVPGADNYMSRLISDAAGQVLGARKGESRSRIITMEDAYLLSMEADIWLNPGYCRSRTQLAQIHQLFPQFGPLVNGAPIYNNTLRTTPGGGNDFWESGVVRPDLILEDLIRIFNEDPTQGSLNYYFKLED